MTKLCLHRKAVRGKLEMLRLQASNDMKRKTGLVALEKNGKDLNRKWSC